MTQALSMVPSVSTMEGDDAHRDVSQEFASGGDDSVLVVVSPGLAAIVHAVEAEEAGKRRALQTPVQTELIQLEVATASRPRARYSFD